MATITVVGWRKDLGVEGGMCYPGYSETNSVYKGWPLT